MDYINIELFDIVKLKLYSILEYSQKYVPYYSNIIKLPHSIKEFTYDYFISEYSYINKSIIQNNPDTFISLEYKKEDLICESTTGSEGTPLICYKNLDEKLAMGKTIFSLRKSYIPNLKLSKKYVVFYGYHELEGKIIHDQDFIQGRTLYLSNFNLYENNLIMYWQRILDYKPSYIFSPPSSIINLANVIKNHKLPMLKLDYIELRGEYVSNINIDYLSGIFQCPIANLYGTREFWDIAYSKNTQGLELINDNVFVESIYDPITQQNELFITTLLIKSWPLIRYQIGDYGQIYKKEDSKYYVNLDFGRKSEWLYFKNGRYLSPPMISSLIRAVNRLIGYNYVTSYQIVKKNNETLIININAKKENEIIENYLVPKIVELLNNDTNIVVNYVDYILAEENKSKIKIFMDLEKENDKKAFS